MALAYNLRFAKESKNSRKMLEKEGEIIFDRKFLRVKGKGANDTGEQIFFTDIREYKIGKDYLIITTLDGKRFQMAKFGSSFEDFLRDFFRMKNEFFAENMFMRQGMLLGQFDCNVEASNGVDKHVNKGKCVMSVFEQSILFMPEMNDAFCIHLSFMKMHEFDEDEYVLNIEHENGVKIKISRLGSSYENCREIFEGALEKMYQKVLTVLKMLLPDFNIQALLKLAYAMKYGKAVSMKALKKIDVGLPAKMLDIFLKGNERMAQKMQFLRSLDKEEELFLGFKLDLSDDGFDVLIKAWFACVLPSQNTMILGLQGEEENIYFFRVITENGFASEKMLGRVLELNQCLLLFDYDASPIFKSKEEIRKSRFKAVSIKLNILRNLRKSLIGKSSKSDLDKFKTESNVFFSQAQISQRPPLSRKF